MNKVRWIKLAGMIGSFGIGISTYLGGDKMTGIGIIMASLSSTTAVSPAAK